MVPLAIRRPSTGPLGPAPGRRGCRVLTVAIGMPMPDRDRVALESALASGFRVVDIRDAPLDTAIVVVPPCSAHAIETLMVGFPRAKILVVEGPWTILSGPVTSAIRAGAYGYAIGETGPGDLAESITWISDRAA
jgi:hypothetical protein